MNAHLEFVTNSSIGRSAVSTGSQQNQT
jgi:hypothetical protein